MKRSLLFFAILFLALPGCNTIQVVDNTYGPMGGQYVKVSDTLEYLGHPDVDFPSYCTQDCPTVSLKHTMTRTDIFASKKGDKISELCVIERRLLFGSYRWNPVKGDVVTYGGKAYVESAALITGDESEYVQTYVNYLKSQGYETNTKGVLVRVLVRNVTNTNQIAIYYGCSIESLPEDACADDDKLADYMRERFDALVQIVDS